jgi:sugar/nucleoside kinase (ribokinase family)
MSGTPGIVVFGEALVDVFDEVALVGGAPFNVARHLAGLGAQPLMITRIADDAHGQSILAEMRRFGMSTAACSSISSAPPAVCGCGKMRQAGTVSKSCPIRPMTISMLGSRWRRFPAGGWSG